MALMYYLTILNNLLMPIKSFTNWSFSFSFDGSFYNTSQTNVDIAILIPSMKSYFNSNLSLESQSPLTPPPDEIPKISPSARPCCGSANLYTQRRGEGTCQHNLTSLNPDLCQLALQHVCSGTPNSRSNRDPHSITRPVPISRTSSLYT